jgi:3-dehydroquinate dehydratase/shikimate dehydrogenase
MGKVVLTIYEPTVERAVKAIGAAEASAAAFEIRLDAMAIPLEALEPIRGATARELILTRRSVGTARPFSAAEVEQAIRAGFDWIDLEYSERVDTELLSRFADRIILSHHDFHATPDTDALYGAIRKLPAGRRKIAATPVSFQDNERLLHTLASARDPHLTVIGMGARGLYSRILAPFFGSELIFAARDAATLAAPAQLTLEQARTIYGANGTRLGVPRALFAVVGNPVGHSRSPEIHNPGFREAGVPAAYSMIEVQRFDELANAMIARESFAPLGVSITAPFKEEAYLFARAHHARITPRAEGCQAVNTLVLFRDYLFADNTDVVGFIAGLQLARRATHAALLGAGGSARAALVALREAGVTGTVYNRTFEKGMALARQFGFRAAPLEAVRGFHGDLIVNALPAQAAVEIPMQADQVYIDVAYAAEAEPRLARARAAGMRVFDGMDFLRAQALPQSDAFLAAAREAES